MDVSIVVPVYHELENIERLYNQLVEAISGMDSTCEILFVDDGSRDGTVGALRTLAERDSRVRVICFRRNFGQTAAMHAGLQFASGKYVVTLDGDLQNDPADIPLLIDKLEEGYDLVHGWRKDRKDAWLHRKLPSRMANWLISRVTKFPIHDLGCTLKAMRREIAKELELYGEMHRFIPILAHQRGARCAEIVVRHHPRRFGQTKYGIGRTVRVILDLITVKYMLDYFASPMKLFGRFGLICGMVGFVAVGATIGMKVMGGVDMTGNPLLMLAVFSSMASVQFFSLGLLGEVNARIYFSQNDRRDYAVRELMNFEEVSTPTNESHRRAA